MAPLLLATPARKALFDCGHPIALGWTSNEAALASAWLLVSMSVAVLAAVGAVLTHKTAGEAADAGRIATDF